VIAVSYYDFRNDVTSGAVLTDCWLLTSSDGVNFTETHLSGPFNLMLAPVATGEGLFLGDYQALRSTSTAFLPMYAQPPATGSEVSTGVFLDFPPASASAAAAGAQAAGFRARALPAGQVFTRAARERVGARIRAVHQGRLPGRS
jgi:hypothetical protein